MFFFPGGITFTLSHLSARRTALIGEATLNGIAIKQVHLGTNPPTEIECRIIRIDSYKWTPHFKARSEARFASWIYGRFCVLPAAKSHPKLPCNESLPSSPGRDKTFRNGEGKTYTLKDKIDYYLETDDDLRLARKSRVSNGHVTM